MSHRANFLCPLKCPGEAGGAVPLDQVGVRLFPVAACPLLHHVIIPLIVTLQRNTLTSYIYVCVYSYCCKALLLGMHADGNMYMRIILPHRQE